MFQLRCSFAGRLVLLAAILAAGVCPAEDAKLTGVWTGQYEYPQESNRPPVKFTATLVQQGESVVGLIREENTFGATDAPQLHASVTGTYYEANPHGGALTFRKTYDGTSGQSHAVVYLGVVDLDAGTAEGVWSLPGDFDGIYSMTRQPLPGAGPLAGVWRGEYQYPDEAGLPGVEFTALLVHGEGQDVQGWIREANTFGTPEEPFLQAEVEGTYDPEEKVLHLTKTYDGTGDASHDVVYTGERTPAGAVTGEWNIADAVGGAFKMQPLPAVEARRVVEERVQSRAAAGPAPAIQQPQLFFSLPDPVLAR